MKTIWIDCNDENVYAEFKREFTWHGGDAELEITASRGYAAYINGCFVSNAQYADMPNYKAVDKIDITPFLSKGDNILSVLAYHWDSDFATARVMPAALAFRITEGGNTVAESDKNTMARVSPTYKASNVKVTPQLGYGFSYDFCDNQNGWERAVEAERDFTYVPRPNKRLEISSPLPSTVVAQGVFKYNGGSTAAEKCMRAWLSAKPFSSMAGEDRISAAGLTSPIRFCSSEGDGIYIIFDLSMTVAGYLSLSVKTSQKCKAIFTWGEHLADLRVRSEIEGRNFATEFYFKKGENKLDEYLHRVGARYLSLFVEADEIQVERFALREAVYPFSHIERSFSDRLIEKIYNTAKRTLVLCAHEHYEDCPWREQALYGMDSRNQMLYGYSAFGEYEYPRSVLRLLAKSARPSGLIELCAPAVAPIVIPSFTLYALLAFAENAEADYNGEFVKEFLPYAEHALSAFIGRMGEYGIAAFTEPEYWNFHEWSEGLDGGVIFRDSEIEPYYDGLLNALCKIVTDKLVLIEQKQGNLQKFKEYKAVSEKLGCVIERYYDSKTGLYFSFCKNGAPFGIHAFTQALYIIAGVKSEHWFEMAAELKSPHMATPLTFAALQFKYDAILRADGDADFCVNEVCEIFGKMLFSGATSLWETETGEADFADAGSLCHAWSSVPCWLFDKLSLDGSDMN